MRERLAYWAGRLALALSRRLGRGGTSLPGRVALRVDPALLGKLARRCERGAVLVSGTNGKTTTARILAGALERSEGAPVHNRSGANLPPGLVTAFLRTPPPWRRALLEVDEAALPRAAAQVPAALLLVTNVFRDQLDRYGEVERTARLIESGIRRLDPGATVVLNADDPRVAAMAAAAPGPVRFFGFEASVAASDAKGPLGDAGRCPRCAAPLTFTARLYAHLGRYLCPGCGFRRPDPEVTIQGFTALPWGSRLEVAWAGGALAVELPLPGLFNAYNALGAAAAALALGVDAEVVGAALGAAVGSFGRFQRVDAGERQLVVALVKNPTGFNEVLRTVEGIEGEKDMLFLLNDRAADGTDVSWLWDVDLERLSRPGAGIGAVTCGGERAGDMAVRLKYAGFERPRLQFAQGVEAALDLALARGSPGRPLVIMPTYTALLALEDVLARRGVARSFWEV